MTALFETDRLVAQHFTHDDLDDFAALCANPEVMRSMGDGNTLPRETVAHWIDVCHTKYATRGYGTSAVFEKASGKFIGYCGVIRAPDLDFRTKRLDRAADPGDEATPADARDDLALLESRGGRRGRRGNSADLRTDARHAVYEEDPVEHDREHEIRDGPGEHDRETLAHALAVESTVRLAGSDGSFTLVEHLHVTAERKCRDHPLGAIGPALAGPQRFTEAHREAHHLYVA